MGGGPGGGLAGGVPAGGVPMRAVGGTGRDGRRTGGSGRGRTGCGRAAAGRVGGGPDGRRTGGTADGMDGGRDGRRTGRTADGTDGGSGRRMMEVAEVDGVANHRQRAGPEPPRADKSALFRADGDLHRAVRAVLGGRGPLLGARGGHHVGGGLGHPAVRGDHRERGQRHRPPTPIRPRARDPPGGRPVSSGRPLVAVVPVSSRHGPWVTVAGRRLPTSGPPFAARYRSWSFPAVRTAEIIRSAAGPLGVRLPGSAAVVRSGARRCPHPAFCSA